MADLGKLRLTFTDSAGRTTTAYADAAQLEWQGPAGSGGWELLPSCVLVVGRAENVQ